MIRYVLVAVLIAFSPEIETKSASDPGQYDASLGSLWAEPIATAKPKYAEIIDQTRNDRSHNSTFRFVCRVLATRVFREECEGCPHIGHPGRPARIERDDITELKANVPALRYCPDVYLLQVPLPIRRFMPRISCHMVENEVSGWVVVDLLLNDEGNVVQASINESTSKLLEDSAIESARRFKYQKIIGGSGYLEENDVKAIIYFDFDEVQNSGACKEGSNGS